MHTMYWSMCQVLIGQPGNRQTTHTEGLHFPQGFGFLQASSSAYIKDLKQSASLIPWWFNMYLLVLTLPSNLFGFSWLIPRLYLSRLLTIFSSHKYYIKVVATLWLILMGNMVTPMHFDKLLQNMVISWLLQEPTHHIKIACANRLTIPQVSTSGHYYIVLVYPPFIGPMPSNIQFIFITVFTIALLLICPLRNALV